MTTTSSRVQRSQGAGALGTAASRSKKKKLSLSKAVVTIQASFNNTIVAFADEQGDVFAWGSAGNSGFKGARKSTPFAAQVAAEKAAAVAKEAGVKTIEVRVSGPGAGRESAIRALNPQFAITKIFDVTPIPHNGCRPRKRRRV